MASKKHPLKKVTLFYSYSHQDEKLRDALATHLALLRRQGIISEWYDRNIDAGEEWREAIDENLNSADIILLLISPPFIASDYCWDKEMKAALKRHDAGEALVVPVIVRPVLWKGTLFEKLQALPKNAKPVTLWKNRDQAWTNVAEGIAKDAQAIAEEQPIDRAPSGSTIVASTPAAPPTPVITKAPLVREVVASRPLERPGAHVQRRVYNGKNSQSLPGELARREGDAPTGDVAIDEAYEALGLVYNFFWDVFQRDSIDGKGRPLNATVHYGVSFNNAFWNGKQMILGDGDGEIFNRFTAAADVIAKEIANGILQVDTTLAWYQQSGALLNSIALVYASLVKQYALKQTVSKADWLIGDKLLAPKVKGKALFSLAEPGTAYDDATLGKDAQPAHMRDYVHTNADSGGTHVNAGIPNRAFYLVATALGGYAWEKAGRIWYETALDKQLKSNAQFRDFARLTYATAHRLYGDKSAEAKAVKQGWEKVGVKLAGK